MDMVYSLGNITTVAQQLWQQKQQYPVWAFYAPMGAGKTTLISALCKTLQVHGAVSSPTFAIINQYQSPVAGTMYHMDWYRLKNEDEAVQAGVEDCLTSGRFCLVEWPEKAEGLLPDNTLCITIEVLDEETRRITATQ
jgi:tRNA threonylcarbamoyladenosine biosynthesis protein TsaE